MFGVDSTELLVVAVVALVVIGPKELPRLLRIVGYWVGKARSTVRQFRAGIDDMIRESELQEMEKKWREENDRIMREFPATGEGPSEVIHDDEPFYPTAPSDLLPSPPDADVAAVGEPAEAAPELPFGPPAAKDDPKPELT